MIHYFNIFPILYIYLYFKADKLDSLSFLLLNIYNNKRCIGDSFWQIKRNKWCNYWMKAETSTLKLKMLNSIVNKKS